VSNPPLFLLDELPDGDTLVLGGEEGHHAARVRRLRAGERVSVGDGRGAIADCEVLGSARDEVSLRVLARRVVPAADPRLVVVQALPKGERAELAVELMTELGVDEIVPWSAARSLTHWDGARGEKALARWRRTAREAAKQSRRPWVPSVSALLSTSGLGGRLAASPALVLHEAADEPLTSCPLPSAGDLLLVVGPEGGIADDELALFTDAGARAVRLGEPVLRTSTAGAAALAVLSARLGRWSWPRG
jgi:16S rRNA (uracil1498-N3)-methyltransferase